MVQETSVSSGPKPSSSIFIFEDLFLYFYYFAVLLEPAPVAQGLPYDSDSECLSCVTVVFRGAECGQPDLAPY